MKRHHLSWTYRYITIMIMLLPIMFPFPSMSIARERSTGKVPPGPKSGWSTFLRGGYVYQSDSDIDNGVSFTANRLAIQGGLSYSPDYRLSVSLALGYGFDGYVFSGDEGFSRLRPWDNIHSFSISTPVRWVYDQEWSVFVIPMLRSTAESGIDLDDALTGGGFAGFAYRFSDRLTIGPGIGVMTQIEDDPSVFPVLLVNWKITDRLSLSTGRGLGATLGPGLILGWKAAQNWDFSLGGRFERLRFRLDKKGNAPGGIGQDRSFPLFGGVTHSFSPRAKASLLGGVELGGELLLEDETGNRIVKVDYAPAGFVGFTFSYRF
jgi:hypothetical protein